MIATSKLKARGNSFLGRFVTKEAIALLLDRHPKDIYKINCWQYVIHVVGKGISTFVSYADLPPIIGVEAPQAKDFLRWRKRWKKHSYVAPLFWQEFYTRKFRAASSQEELQQWGDLLSQINRILPKTVSQQLQEIYWQEKQKFPPVS